MKEGTLEGSGERLARIRDSHGMTEAALAVAAGVSRRVIAYDEQEDPQPPGVTRDRLGAPAIRGGRPQPQAIAPGAGLRNALRKERASMKTRPGIYEARARARALLTPGRRA